MEDSSTVFITALRRDRTVVNSFCGNVVGISENLVFIMGDGGSVVAPASSMIEQPTKPDFPRPPDPIDKPPPDVKPVPPPDIPVPNSPDVQTPTFPERGDGPPVT